MSVNSFGSRSTLKVGSKEYEIYRLDALDQQGISTKHLPFSLRILLENLLRTEDGRNVTKGDRLVYDLASGQAAVQGGGQRVQGLFMPGGADGPGAAKKK